MGHQQKGKHHKRKRSWHHLANQDHKWARAARRLERALTATTTTRTKD